MSSTQLTEKTEPPGAQKVASDDPLQPIWEAIWARRPILGDIMNRHGRKNLYDYTKDFFDVNPSPRLDARKEVLIATVQNILSKRLGENVAQGVARQLHKLALVSTADHHGFIVSPFFVNSNIVTGLRYHDHDDLDLQYLIAFSFAGVSLNNSSQPRSLLFYGTFDGSGELYRLPLLPDKEKMGTVYRMRSYTGEDLKNAQHLLHKREQHAEIEAQKAEGVHGLLEEVFATSDVMEAPDFAAQITQVNYHLWPKLFHPQKRKVPDLIYLDIETLVTELLLEHHLADPQSLIYQLLFSPLYRPLISKYFNNIQGAFSVEKDWGTYLFWALDAKNHRVRLQLKGDQLISRDENFTFGLQPEEIAGALREKKIFPSMILCYVLISFYYGIKCLGGFCQVSDLTRAKEAWSKILQEAGETKEAEALEPVQTKELGGDGVVLAYLQTKTGDLVPANAVDLILNPKGTPWEYYPSLAKTVSFRNIMNPLVLEIYKVLFSEEDRVPEYLTFNTEQILELTGLREKILAAARS